MRWAVLSAALVTAAGFSGNALAGETEAREYIEKAKKDVADNNAGSAKTNLDMAEAELDGVADGPKKTLTDQIAKLRESMNASANSEEREALKKDIDKQLADMKRSLDDGRPINDDIKTLDETLNDKKNAQLLGADNLAGIQKKLSTYRKIAAKRNAEKALERLKTEVESVTKRLAEVREDLARGIKEEMPAVRDSALETMSHMVDDLEKLVGMVGEDNPKAAEEIAFYKKTKAEYESAYAKARTGDKLDQMTRGWEIYKEEWDGWEKETGTLTFSQMLKEQSEAMSKLNGPKSVELVERANIWLAARANDDDYKLIKDDPRVKALVEDIRAKRQTAWDKLARNADAVLKEAEGMKIDFDARNRLDTFVRDDLRIALEEYPKLPELQARGYKLVKAFDDEKMGAEKAAEKAYADATAAAEQTWPKIVEKYKPAEGFDPANWKAFKGKVIRLQDASNRMGWDYKPGDFDFAMTINGVALAGKYDPAIQAAIASLRERTKHGLPLETPYDVFAIVETEGKLMQRVQGESKGKVEGVEVTATWEKSEPVDAVVLRIVALHCGPVAASAGR
jgi:hypothetical protein